MKTYTVESIFFIHEFQRPADDSPVEMVKVADIVQLIKEVALQWKPGDGPAACQQILARLGA